MTAPLFPDRTGLADAASLNEERLMTSETTVSGRSTDT